MQPEERDGERIRLYRESIGSAWGHGDGNTWPVKLNAAFHLFLKEFGEELIDDLAYLEQRKTPAEIARPFYNPARLYRIIDSTIYGMRRNHYSVAQQRAVVLKLLDLCKSLKYGSEFNEDGRNVIYDPATVEETAEKLDQPLLSVEESKIVHRFCAVMWAYTEAICFRAHDVTKEIHGSYPCDGGRKHFIVKEYLNLSPRELWPDAPLLPCSTIRIYKQYNDNVRIRIDALNHLYHEGGQLVPNLEACCVEVDGRRVEIELLREYLARVQQTIGTISRYIESISWNERVLKYAEIFWFRKKPFRDQRGCDWRVPPHVRNTIRNGMENERRRTPLSDEASARLAMLTI